MDESGPKILTQTEFNKTVLRSYTNVVHFENYIVDNIAECVVPWFYTITFSNCKIKSLYCIADSRGIDNVFNACEIVDYDKIPHYGVTFDKDCIFVKPRKSVCPEEGAFIGWKKCLFEIKINGMIRTEKCIVKLWIPKDAKRSNAFSNKCRCSKAKVLGVYDLFGNELTGVQCARSACSCSGTKYVKDRWVYPDSFDEEWYRECSHGIHFFMTFDEAVDYLI